MRIVNHLIVVVYVLLAAQAADVTQEGRIQLGGNPPTKSVGVSAEIRLSAVVRVNCFVLKAQARLHLL